MNKVIEIFRLLSIVLLFIASGCSFDNGSTTTPTENTTNNSLLTLKTPLDGTTGISVFGTNLQWTSTASIGTVFQVFLEPTTGKSVLPTSASWNTTPKAVGITSTSYNPGQLTYSTWYAWKIRALLPSGTWLDSPVQYFQTENIPASASNILKVYDYKTNFDPNNLNTERIINIILQVTDPAGNGIINLTKDQFEVLEDGEQLREGSIGFSALPASKISMPVNIVIDNSTSIKANNRLQQIKTDATEIVTRLSTIPTLKSYFNIYQFSENLFPQVGTITPPGVSADQAKLEIANIQNGVSSTDFYGAVADVASTMFNSYTVEEVKNHIMVVLSDGDDTAGKRSLSEATNAVASKRVYSIGYAGDLREDILKMVGVSGYFNRSLSSDFSSYLLNIRTYLENYSRSFYMLTVTSPKRGYKNHTISIRMHGSLYPVNVSYPGW